MLQMQKDAFADALHLWEDKCDYGNYVMIMKIITEATLRGGRRHCQGFIACMHFYALGDGNADAAQPFVTD